MRNKLLISLFFISLSFTIFAQNRWKLEPDGSIGWLVKKGDAHTDNIEMSGRFISAIITYGVFRTKNLRA